MMWTLSNPFKKQRSTVLIYEPRSKSKRCWKRLFERKNDAAVVAAADEVVFEMYEPATSSSSSSSRPQSCQVVPVRIPVEFDRLKAYRVGGKCVPYTRNQVRRQRRHSVVRYDRIPEDMDVL
ncbi:hypothetical protein LEN26_011934 [Aphanomyces euteiches]|nr:hypothetical protein LEN26_011934 [Aphanomyces euteiches]KAH9123679.1 hypothetical protein AeMF1_005411 [Aphanomyces euteiches]KAH9184913.1 hypothetical protein AeNC1_013114 [Aphanomyces euteiches]